MDHADTQQEVSAPLSRNPVSLAGVWLTTLAAFAFLGYLIAGWFGLFATPYAGLIGYVAIPAVFLLGLALVPIGIWRESRRRRRGEAAWRWPAVDLGIRHTRMFLGAVLLLTVVNVTLIGVAGFGATHYMETTEFCGQVCHEPMKPEFTAHQVYPHANVACVSCHIGAGAAGLVRAKLNGTRQLYLVTTGDYARPIPVPARGLPNAAETCERCHTPGRPERDIALVTHEFAGDEANTETVTETLMFTSKNHWHARKDIRVEYIATDAIRETIPYVKVTNERGQVTEFFAAEAATAPAGVPRRMDCLDCHTRPAHTFSPSAEAAVDRALAAGQLPRTLPFVRRETVAALTADYADQGAATTAITQRLSAFYATRPDAPAADVSHAVAGATRVYTNNVFPGMKVTWGTYLSQRGHDQQTGCFRCHDDDHKSRDGRVIKQDCALCHKKP